ncbi:MAG: hypothetical protein AAF642_00730 [Pseudomonadota bacterium]
MPFIAFLGLAATGKTTIANHLANHFHGASFNEPAREDWPLFVTEGFETSAFEVMQWFRCFQVEAIQKAKRSGEGIFAFTDAYYQKILSYYLHAPSSGWIIDPADPYFKNFSDLCSKDRSQLPNADYIIFLKADYSNWRQLVSSRQGPGDNIVLEKAFATQEEMEQATKSLCAEESIPLLILNQEFGKLENTINKIIEWLEREEMNRETH